MIVSTLAGNEPEQTRCIDEKTGTVQLIKSFQFEAAHHLPYKPEVHKDSD